MQMIDALQYNPNAPTKKQKEYISDIQNLVGVTFIGRTRQEAADFIDEYREAATTNALDLWLKIH